MFDRYNVVDDNTRQNFNSVDPADEIEIRRSPRVPFERDFSAVSLAKETKKGFDSFVYSQTLSISDGAEEESRFGSNSLPPILVS